MDKFRTLELFLATCEQGSFAGAARECGTDPSTVSKAISRLETELGLTLFQRSTRKLSITLAGQEYAQTAKNSLDAILRCEASLKHNNDTPSGLLRISTAVCYGHLYLRPLLKAFCLRYPDIQLDLEISDMHADIIEKNIDIAIRTGFVKDNRLVARRLSPMDFLICASPDYLAQNGLPKYDKDFEQHTWIGFRIKQTQQLQPIFLPNSEGEYGYCELSRQHITDDGGSMAPLCIDGFGFAQMPHFLAKEALEQGKLVSVFPSFRPPEPENGVFAIYPKREFLPAKVRVFIEFIIEHLQEMGEGSYHTWAQTLNT
ncbi:LysR family transcriptional regulator [Catenovulum sp. SM1970]|uniref:LysR family transcriptional regulator n=1 Tax=Marinifaba aquimaris TaxID=2741323 RepID=UPI001571A56F|nr:LysR family transcriptional regulator [Marinifaba aquimaris]NTS77052.1 LysR family transcriptional regulator [Marinifaba aquimaris]